MTQRRQVVDLYVGGRKALAQLTGKLIQDAVDRSTAEMAAAHEDLRRRMSSALTFLLGSLTVTFSRRP
ncbi:hypothetical protein [Streptomyces sp. 891-h]|uniref:hypothetical protein n=1 Tax=Streptomyces sp. 891-h TaxID=2720714 RepID=UPI001FAA04F7|nr:hypothetical protein [Streptomyces sp. 891-h]UNZ21201.1 hypothetical protein HC362_33115 [Streptomyces sp. 891-h]